MGSEAAEAEKAAPEANGSPSEDVDLEQRGEEAEEQVTPAGEEKRGTKRESPEKEGDGAEEEGSKSKRPSRERKTVERYSAVSPRKLSASKSLKIAEGAGTKLKDIPNVAFKLSKRKADENLRALHTILFGRKSNTHFLKRNILQFSGFVWIENKEKHKAKVKEKLDKFTKDKLIDFCELLDIHFPRTSTKKEDVSAMLLEFLESPHVTRDLLLADKEKKGKKRRSRMKVSREAAEDASPDKETKKLKKGSDTEVGMGRKPATEEDDDGGSDGSDGMKDAFSGEEDNNGLEEESDHDKLEEDDEENVSEEPQASKKESDDTKPEDGAELVDKGRTSAIKKCSSVKSEKSLSKHVSKKTTQPIKDEPDVVVDSKHGSTKDQTRKGSKAATKEKAVSVKKEDKKKSSRKSASVGASDMGSSKSSKSKEDGKKGRNKEKTVVEDKKTRKKKDAKPAPKVSKEQGKGKKKAGPSAEELHSVVTNILKEVDFNTATLVDILKQLGAHFNMDLMDRKTEVKSIIEEVINNMTDDEDDSDENEDNLDDKQEVKKTMEEESEGDGKE